MKPFARLALAAAAAATVAAGVASAPPARAETAAEAVATFKEYLKTNPDAQGLKNQIAELAQKKDPLVADVLMPLLKNPKMDDDIKAEVCRAAGQQNKPEVVTGLFFWVEHKSWEEKPKLIAAALEGIGYANAKGAYKQLIKIGKKHMDSNADITGAAYRAASLYVSRETVDDLISALTTSDAALDAKAAAKRGPHDAVKPQLIDMLKKVTGKDINDVKVWIKWWGDNKDKWEPPAAGGGKAADINASMVFSDDAYAFSISKPNKAWSFKKPDGNSPFLTVDAFEDGARAAWVEMYVFGTKNYVQKTPELMAKSVRETLEGKFRDFKSAEWDKKGMCGGLKSVEHLLNGQHKDFDAVHMHNVFVEKGEVMYYFLCVYKSGKKASFETDIEDILKSFKLTR